MEGFKCSHAEKSNYSVITPNQHLKPINGKITWHVDENSLTADMEKYKVLFAFEQAFNKWAEVLFPITFQSVAAINDAQIVIKFKKNGDEGLPYQFDDTTLAYAFAPQDTSLGMHADMFFNDQYKWDEIHKADSIYLFKVVVHELGHCFNIGHQTTDIKDIMYPIYQPIGDVVINSDTRKGIYDLYKQYGVQLPNQNSVDKEVSQFIKGMYKTKNDVLKLSQLQLQNLASALGITFSSRDNLSKRVNIIWTAILAIK
jgi:predicted Zn-dependent protease